MKNGHSIVKLIVSLLSMLIGSTALTSPQCIQVYSGDYVKVDGPVTSSVAAILGVKGRSLSDAVDIFSEKSIEQTNSDRRLREEIVHDIVTDKAFDKERFAGVYKRLVSSQFLLSPIHELLYSMAQGLRVKPFEANDYYRSQYQVKKSSFVPAKKSIEGSLDADGKTRAYLAGKMLSYLYDRYSGLLDIRDWHTLDSSGRYIIAEKIAKITTSKVKVQNIISMIDTLSEMLRESDDHPHLKLFYLKKVFEFTMPEIHDVAAARARGLPTLALKNYSPALLGATAAFFGVEGLLGHNPIEMINFFNFSGNDIGLGTAFGVFGGVEAAFGLPHLETFRDGLEVPGRVSSFVTRTKKRFGLKSKVFNRADADIEASKIVAQKEEEARQLERISRLSSSKDQDFNAIKLELKNRNLAELIDISRWGTSFKRANTNLAERMSLFSEKMNLLQSDLIAAKEIDGTTAELEISQRDGARVTLDQTYQKLALAITEINALKYDTLALAVALDRYKELLNTAKAKKASEPGVDRVFEGTESIFSLMEQTLLSMASLTTTFDSRLIDDLNLVSTIRASIDADVVIHQIQKNRFTESGQQ